MALNCNLNHINMSQNPLGMQGLSFIEFSSESPDALRRLFLDLGFALTHKHPGSHKELWTQNQICLLLNSDPGSYGLEFSKVHGPTISSMGWSFVDPGTAFSKALERGAKVAPQSDYLSRGKEKVPAILGIGDTLIYFVSARTPEQLTEELGFVRQEHVKSSGCGFLSIDHLTNNVSFGTMGTWQAFYRDIFGFQDVRTFKIRGNKTSLQSYALRSPDGSFCIPINEASESKSQINEFIEKHQGPGIQHLAFLTGDLLGSLESLQGTSVSTLDIQESYYKHVFKRVPGVKEDHDRIKRFNVLVDGDADGYLLQIFTKEIVGPMFIELIQRNNHLSFGEGNFQALFDSIERDQERRGVL